MASADAPEAVRTQADLEVYNREPSVGLGPALQPHGYDAIPTYNPPGTTDLKRSMGRWQFATLAALVAAIVVGAAVGGGLGKSLSDFSSTINYVPLSSSQISNLSFSCEDGRVVQNSGKFLGTYTTYCGRNFGTHVTANETDLTGKSLLLDDILGIIAYTLEDCLQTCSVTQGLATSPMPCRSLYYNADIQFAVSEWGANCWIKNGTPADIASVPVYPNTIFLSATLNDPIP
ncbi:uncharacterized protein A1O9_05156 [Exophiala aquamarina CBS 119918]|uniref:Apple domain-containing protein n=1 Tax=Exophiala aquamarina CBS 119918 TaxID=1182545 RepID=A0A072PAY0_9EURO|nr:uncharacterized protein A1O9_05156 [Exophiala aquamarina CBS 119918]KEF57239.1 hypothetical protein A1O9_05156 [Exophiala aquamarina CBS 119918]